MGAKQCQLVHGIRVSAMSLKIMADTLILKLVIHLHIFRRMQFSYRNRRRVGCENHPAYHG